jgi:hypothetical protein
MGYPPRSPSPTQPWPAATVAALLLTLERPASWWVALAGFLARGGLILFALPILVLHTPAGVQTELSPLLVPFLFGGSSSGFITLSITVAALGAFALLAGGIAGAWSDRVLILHAAYADADATGAAPEGDSRQVLVVLTARWLAHVPLLVALGWGAARVVTTVYREVTVPFEVVTPLLVRIVVAVPDALAVIGVAWLLGEAAGGLAAREVVLGRRGGLGAAVAGWAGIVRRPLASLATVGWTSLALAVAVGPGLLAAAAAWRWVRAVLWDGGEPLLVVAAIGVFIALWLATLALTGFACALRSNAWTAEWLRRRGRLVASEPTPPRGWAGGTIGDAEGTRQEGWPSSGASGTL